MASALANRAVAWVTVARTRSPGRACRMKMTQPVSSCLETHQPPCTTSPTVSSSTSPACGPGAGVVVTATSCPGGARWRRLGTCLAGRHRVGWLAALRRREYRDCTALAGRMHVHIVIMGCGRVGSSIAHTLEESGHSVAVIDQDPEAFRKLASGFKGNKVTGIGFDRDVLTEAGIERADAFAAVSSGDNSNVIAARVARESFGVQRVVGPHLRPPPGRRSTSGWAFPPWRPSRGRRTRCCAASSRRARSRCGATPPARWCWPRSRTPTTGWARRSATWSEAASTRVAYISRLGEAVVPGPSTVLQEGDVAARDRGRP